MHPEHRLGNWERGRERGSQTDGGCWRWTEFGVCRNRPRRRRTAGLRCPWGELALSHADGPPHPMTSWGQGHPCSHCRGKSTEAGGAGCLSKGCSCYLVGQTGAVPVEDVEFCCSSCHPPVTVTSSVRTAEDPWGCPASTLSLALGRPRMGGGSAGKDRTQPVTAAGQRPRPHPQLPFPPSAQRAAS